MEPRWLGRCPGCSAWNSFVEEASETASRGLSSKAVGKSLPGAGGRPVSLGDVPPEDMAPRYPTGFDELDRVLGGGLVPGSITLLGGDPGVGKSTLLLQALGKLAEGHKVLYVSGEESVAQTSLRATRLGIRPPSLLLYSETCLERILHESREAKPAILAVDSIQTVYTEVLDGIPGSLGQVRECAGRLMSYAKTSGVPVILVGHVTKDGAIAGPKTLEHVVDTVLHFEGEGAHPYRIVRALKNRFGSTSEIGVFEMRHQGLTEVANPSALFLSERPEGVPGSVVVASADGSRPLLVEVQGLVSAATAGFGRRTVAGVDANRVGLLLAVLAERAGLPLLDQDVFVNVAGGIKLTEPAADLGVAAALASAFRRKPVHPHTLVFGEVGLAGEVRGVSLAEPRLAEARKLGFRRAILPRQNAQRLENHHGLELTGVSTLAQALEAVM